MNSFAFYSILLSGLFVLLCARTRYVGFLFDVESPRSIRDRACISLGRRVSEGAGCAECRGVEERHATTPDFLQLFSCLTVCDHRTELYSSSGVISGALTTDEGCVFNIIMKLGTGIGWYCLSCVVPGTRYVLLTLLCSWVQRLKNIC